MPTVTSNLYPYLWQAPGKRLSISLDLNLVGRLEPLVTGVCQSQSWRALEIGGLLLGRKTRTVGGVVTEIEDYEPLRCEHAFGASYLLSPNDRAALEKRIRWHNANGRLEVIGFYRSHTRHGFDATMEDVDLMTAHFSEPWNVLLLIQADRDRTPTAGFVVWESRKIGSRTPHETFPFTVEALAKRVAPRERRTASGTSAAPAAPNVTLWMRTMRGRDVVAASGSTLWTRAMRGRDSVTAVGSGLWARVIRGRDGATASCGALWTRAMRGRVVVAASCGALWTRAMQGRVVVAASGSALWTRAMRGREGMAAGWLRLRHAGAALRPRMQFSARQVAISAGIVAAIGSGIALRHRASGSGPVGHLVSESMAAVLTQTPNSAPITPAALVAEAPAPAAGDTPPPVVTRKRTSGRARRSFSMDSVANREILSSAGEEAVTAAALFELPPAPEISPNSDAESGEPEALENGILATRLPPAPDPFVTATIDANQRPDRGNVLHKIFGGRHIRPDFVPARALHQVNPDVPEAMRRRLKNEVEVSVRLYLDSAGIVQYAELLSDGTGANRDLATLAVFSSRHWQFVPAHMGDAAVPAVVVVRFRFGRERDSGVSSTDGAM